MLKLWVNVYDLFYISNINQQKFRAETSQHVLNMKNQCLNGNRRKNHYDNLPNENHGGSLGEFSLYNFSTEQGPLDYTL